MECVPSEGERYLKDKRNSPGYSERFVQQGELHLSLGWPDSLDDESGATNDGKTGPILLPRRHDSLPRHSQADPKDAVQAVGKVLHGFSRIVGKVKLLDYTTLGWWMAGMELEVSMI
jgi:hypothetical protein